MGTAVGCAIFFILLILFTAIIEGVK